MTIVETCGLFEVTENGAVVKTYKCKADAERFMLKMSEATSINSVNVLLPTKFSVTQRFNFLSQLVAMVLSDVNPSLLITGSAGAGKSYTVLSMLEDKEEGEDYVIIKGYSTARMLYNTLWQENGKIIIFDDTDAILTDKVAVNILKAALDSYGKRTVTWNAMMSQNDETPNSFDFTGKIIFLSNLDQANLDKAVKSRSLLIDLHMTNGEIIERMESIIDTFLSDELDLESKSKALDFIKTHMDSIPNLNMRTWIKVGRICKSFPDNWEQLALYSVLN
jgi:predicted ATP-dependent Lon-type protease